MSGAKTIILASEAAREFDALDLVVRERVEIALVALAVDSSVFRNQIKRLKGQRALRLRIGDWRIIFDLNDGEIVVLAIAHRREVYRLES